MADITMHGLTSVEAARRLEANGFNELPQTKNRTLITLILEVVREPMFLLLIACGSIYFLLGDVHEGMMLLGFVILVMGITIYQENKTERALEALRDLSSPRALVIRDGERKRIAGREVVEGDLIVLAEGDRVAADALVVECSNLMADESLLTGESVPVRKSEGAARVASPGGDDLPYVYSGSLIVSGQGLARVKSTGARTELGKIGKALEMVEPEKTRLEKETDELVRNFAIIGIVLCVLVALVYGLTRGNWLESLLAGITLAMSILPEEFPVVLTIFLALGAWRMSHKNVLARRKQAIQALGSATVLCVDKTGTLTMNRMTVKELYAAGRRIKLTPNIPEEYHQLVEFSKLSSHPQPFDPMEKAIHSLAMEPDHQHNDWKLVKEYPLTKERLAVIYAWSSEGHTIVATKGAPESIANLCHLDDRKVISMHKAVLAMADDGLRVLGVARAKTRTSPLPIDPHDYSFEFIGLLGFEDPVKPNVAEAIAECRAASIRVVMITGDYPGTARNIGKQIGLTGDLITGPELDKMTDPELRKKIGTASIFARAVPEQKLRIVNALKANGEIVAMTGDGVNDAPALKSADIGIAMGKRGTDVARESSSVVLLDDEFLSIVSGVRMGRRIFDNLRKAMAYIVAVHIPIAGITVLSVLMMWPLILLPVHIMFLELIIDPACSVVFEAKSEEPNIMKRPPKNPKERMLNRRTWIISCLQGLAALAAVAIVFKLALAFGRSETEARAMSFTTLIICNLGLILANRSWDEGTIQSLRGGSRALWLMLGGSSLFLAATLNIPLLRQLFKFSALGPLEIGVCLTAGVASIAWFEFVKAKTKEI